MDFRKKAKEDLKSSDSISECKLESIKEESPKSEQETHQHLLDVLAGLDAKDVLSLIRKYKEISSNEQIQSLIPAYIDEKKNESMNLHHEVPDLEYEMTRNQSSSKDEKTVPHKIRHISKNTVGKEIGKINFPNEKSISTGHPSSKSELKILEYQRNTSVQVKGARGKFSTQSSSFNRNMRAPASNKSNSKASFKKSKDKSGSKDVKHPDMKLKLIDAGKPTNLSKAYNDVSLTSFLLSPGRNKLIVNAFEEEKHSPNKFQNKSKRIRSKSSCSSESLASRGRSYSSELNASKNSIKAMQKAQRKDSELSKYKMPLMVLPKAKKSMDDSSMSSKSDQSKKNANLKDIHISQIKDQSQHSKSIPSEKSIPRNLSVQDSPLCDKVEESKNLESKCEIEEANNQKIEELADIDEGQKYEADYEQSKPLFEEKEEIKNDGVYDNSKYQSIEDYMKECDRQQRFSKQNDYFSSRDSKIPKRENLPSHKMFQQIEIDDFSSLLGLISDLEIIKVTDAEIQLKNESMDIIINKANFIDSLFNLGIRKAKSKSPMREDQSYFPRIQCK